MISAQQLDALDPQTRQALLSMMAELAARDEQLRAKDALIEQREREAAFKQALIDKLTHEMAVPKRLKFAATSERFASTLSPEQKSLLDETLDGDLAELGHELDRRRGDGDKDARDETQKKPPSAPSCRRTCRGATCATSRWTRTAAAGNSHRTSALPSVPMS